MPRLIALRRIIVIRGMTGLICLALLLASCSSLSFSAKPAVTSTPTPYPTATRFVTVTPLPTIVMPATRQESPLLAAQVNQGRLIPLSQRLPAVPKVVRVTQSIGKYGGTWNMAMLSSSGTDEFIRTVVYEPLVRWTSDWSGVEPNLAESYAVNSTATEYTFHLRKGLRWSDGEPFTTEDIRFWYEDVLLNPDLTPVIPNWLQPHGQVAKFLFTDETTFVVHFNYPNSLFLEQLATPDALSVTNFPAHYMRSFHPKYTDAAELEAQVKNGGYVSWAAFFIDRVGVNPQDVGSFRDPKRPRMSAWILYNGYNPRSASVSWTRNPYYWKVDPQGNQLPYIDTVTFTVVKNLDELINQTMSNKVDTQDLNALGLDLLANFKDKPNSNYTLYQLRGSTNNAMVINLNLAHPNDARRAVFQNKDFRIGLSYAINRQEILDLIFNGQGKPWQAAPRDDSPFFDADMATQYTGYDKDKANQYLDQAGLKKDQLGHRLWGDGSQLSFAVEVLDNKPQQIAMLNLVAKHLSQVGINLQPHIDSPAVFDAIVQANRHDAAAWAGGGTNSLDILLNPNDYIASSSQALWAVTWANVYYRVPGYENIRIDNAARTSLDMYDRIWAARNRAEQIRLMNSAMLIARESFWTIGIALEPEQYGIVSKRMHNFPKQMPASWVYPNPAPANPEQFFIDQ